MTLQKMLQQEINDLYRQRDTVLLFIEDELLNTIDNEDMLNYVNQYRQLTKKIRLLEEASNATD